MSKEVGNKMSKEFWSWVKNEDERTIYFDGCIAKESWFDDDITPKQFKTELTASEGDISVWLNSPGGDVFAAAQIFTMLKEYKGKVTVKIDGLAASAASVIAMSGDEVVMSPTAVMMIHNPATLIFGEAADLQSGIEMLGEVKESIINAYQQKTGLGRTVISRMMDSETWFNAKKAVELGFADRILYEETKTEANDGYIFDKVTVTNALIKKLPKVKQIKPVLQIGTPHEQLLKRLELLKY